MINIRPSGNIILSSKKQYFKIPWRLHSYQENLLEKKNILLAEKDPHFSKYLPVWKNFGPILKIERLYKIRKENLLSLVTSYFKESFKEKKDWQLKELISFKSLELFISDSQNQKSVKIVEICSKINLPTSSIHGDFHPENIMIDKEEKLKFIDWTRYNSSSSRFFDLIDYSVFSQKDSEEMWFDRWQKLYKIQPAKLFEIDIKKEYLTAYALWKISEELRTLYSRKMLNKYKVKKYQKFLDIITELC